MPRLVDDLFHARRGAPRAWAHHYGSDRPRVAADDPAEVTAALVAARAEAVAGRVVDATAAVALYAAVGPCGFVELPPVAPLPAPEGRGVWVECDRPADWTAAPARWGWLWRAAPAGATAEAFAAAGVEAIPRLAGGLYGRLALGADGDDGGRAVAFPQATAVVALDASGRVLGPPVCGFPFPVDLDAAADVDGALGLVTQLVGPSLFALACLASPRAACAAAAVDPAARPAAWPYERLDVAAIAARLRYDLQAGIVGLGPAIAAAPETFPGPAPRPALLA